MSKPKPNHRDPRPENRGLGRQQAADAAPPPQDIESQALMARARRVRTCELEVFAAIRPILERYRCRLGTVQEVVDGQPGAMRVVVMANE
jgi:hypothetical protein